MQWVFIGGYFVVFFALLIGGALWRKKSRKTRAPFPDNAKLLRGPGETLRRKLAELEERELNAFILAFAIPLAVGASLAWIATHLDGAYQITGLITAVSGLLVSLIFLTRRLIGGIDRWRNTWLGYFGERVVAESLEPLKAAGFQIFHDVPAGDAKSLFNIDHVIIGPSGVFAIETKTRRKGRARAGFAEHQIIYDGQVLAYPWGEDRHGLDQALRQARWLEDHLAQLIGLRTPVQAILTFPGWMVISRARGEVAVLNPKQIPAAVTLHADPILDAHQLDLIGRQLDARCRDVEF
ncbi:nuclease-related domain-containing protein [Rariglobus hedericola]|uniref:NERD domain-containing protein n=1 Tax=Rariglobus hedericola TaxID=2597822 RepID=A0A556QKP8_9BACT|nr:nuclease-related domain-containing protein [Rariglobus hedericola]TSJ77220.1 NERD domain-containing protein [Rariglobus hedericola]